jgi:predicted metal-dependent enzyme (double-stranded beta helix superfamily)
MTEVIDGARGEEALILERGGERLGELVSHDDWLDPRFAAPNPDRYQQFLLYCDPYERLSVVSFVWGPGQQTPVHDHMVWGLIGVLRGAETCEEFDVGERSIRSTQTHALNVGEIDRVSPTIGDVHRVSNALAEEPSISIHVYGGNIGAVHRHVFDERSGLPSEFISGYSSTLTPNLWDRSDEGA